MLDAAVIEIAPVPVEPLVGSPLFSQALSFLLKYNLLLSKSTATQIIVPVEKEVYEPTLLPLL